MRVATILCAVVLWPAIACAQYESAPQASWTLGATGGLAAVRQTGGQAGLEIARPLTGRIAVVAEGVWFQDTATRRRQEIAATIAAFLTQTGQQSTFEIAAPAGFFGGGLRYFLLAPRSVRPYLSGTAGTARVTLTPTVTVGGADVTHRLAEFGVTLGSDLTGSSTTPAFTLGAGVQFAGSGPWLVDAGARVTAIHGDTVPGATVMRATVGVSRGF